MSRLHVGVPPTNLLLRLTDQLQYSHDRYFFRRDHVSQSSIWCCASWLLLLLFLTFSVLVANPNKLLYTVANPARGLLNGEKRTKEKSGSIAPPPPPPTLLVRRK